MILMEYKYVIYEKKGEIAYVTLNKPEKLNAMTFIGREEDFQNFLSALDEAAEDDEVKVVVIKGAGKAFCAGQDLTRVGRVYGMGEGKPDESRVGQLPRLK